VFFCGGKKFCGEIPGPFLENPGGAQFFQGKTVFEGAFGGVPRGGLFSPVISGGIL